METQNLKRIHVNPTWINIGTTLNYAIANLKEHKLPACNKCIS